MFLTDRHEQLKLLLAASMGLLAATAAHSTPFVVGITAGIDWPAFGGNSTSLDHQISAEIVSRLQAHSRLSFWSFAATDPSKQAAWDLEFRFSAIEEQENVIVLRVEELIKGRPPEYQPPPWTVEWLKPGDIERLGLTSFLPLPRTIAAAFDSNFFSVHEVAFRRELEAHAPLAVGGHWLSRPPSSFEIVVPLAWEQYKDLSKSEFRIQCLWRKDSRSSIDNVYLQSFATGTKQRYSESGASFPALVVVARRRDYAGTFQEVKDVAQEVGQLQMRFIYLTREDASQGLQVIHRGVSQ
jgi:hypothetical protein